MLRLYPQDAGGADKAIPSVGLEGIELYTRRLRLRWGIGCLDDVEGEAPLKLHTGGSEDGAQGARGASLFADHFSNIAGRHVEAENDGFGAGNEFDANGLGVIHECLRDLSQQGLHLGDSSVRFKTIM